MSEDIAPKYGKSQNFTEVLMVGPGGMNLTPTIQTYVKCGDFVELLYIVNNIWNKSYMNFIYDLFHISLTFISFTGTYELTIDLLPMLVAS